MKYKLGDICEIVSGSTPKTSVEEYWDGDKKWITPAELSDDSYIINDSARKITELGVKKTGLTPFPEGTVILSSRAPIGKVAIAGCEMYCNQGFKNLICSDKINNRYLYWFLKGNTEYLNSLGRGATFKEISKGIVSEIVINVPDNDRQERAVKNLEKISKIIKLRKHELEVLDELIKARFVELFGNRKFEKEQLIELIQEGAGLSYGIVVPGDNVENGIPMVRPSDFKNGNLILDNVYRVAPDIESKYKKTRLLGDEILVQVIGQPGQVMLCNERCKGMNVTRNLAVIRIDKYKADRLFISHYLTTEEAQRFMFGSTNQSTLKQLPLNKLKELPVPLVPLSEQEQFAEFVKQVDKSKVAVQKALDDTQLLFDSLMQDYFG